MRILYFHQHFSTPDGATGIRSYEMARRLAQEGHQVTMVCGSYGAGKTGLQHMPFVHGRRRGRVAGFEVVEFELPYSNRQSFLQRTMIFLGFAWKAVRLVFKEDYDLLFATSTPLTAAIPGIIARWFRGKKFVFEVRDLWPELPRAMGVIKNPLVLALMSILEWAAYKSAHQCIGLAPGICKGIEGRGIPTDRVTLIPNGCDLEIFESGEPWQPEGVAESDFVAVYTGTHGLANGLDAVLDAAAVLKARKRERIKLVFVGEGMTKERLCERVQRERLTNCLFLPSVDKKQLSGLLRRANLGLMILANVPAFYFGTSPNKFFDYIASEKPVLNNYTGWIASLIEKWKCGFTVPPEDPEAFATALETAADNPDLLKGMGANAIALARKEFDRKRLAESFAKCLAEAYLRNP